MRDGFSEREIVYRAEDLILRLRDVRSCRIITDEKGAISEIHVVASSDRSPKFIARDVETALKAELDLEIDYRKIGVVLMDPVGGGKEDDREPPLRDRPFFNVADEPLSTDRLVDERLVEVEPGASPPTASPPEASLPRAGSPETTPFGAGPPDVGEIGTEQGSKPFFERSADFRTTEPVSGPVARPAPESASGPSAEDEATTGTEPGLEFLENSTRIGFRGLSLSMEENSIRTEVKLSGNGMEVTGCIEESCGSRPVFEAIAGAAVKALVELLDEDFHLCLSEIRELEITGRKALVAVVDMIRGRDSSSFSGCAFVGRDSGEAAVLAVLDAVNRPFGRWKSRREIHYRIR